MLHEMYEIVEVPIEVSEVVRKVESRNAGATVVFLGTVRELTNGKRTLSLEYEAYPSMAVRKLADIGEEIRNRWPSLKVAITHRIGRLDISEVAVVIAVSSPHRRAAYEANEYAIERIKEIVPIWKKEHWDDGSKWIGNQLETHSFE
ncbi:MAG: molybdenum cofactor biosynthesis protein MoaE [Lysinibacillus sp.]